MTKVTSHPTKRNRKYKGMHTKVVWNHDLMLRFLGSSPQAMAAKFRDADLQAPTTDAMTMWRHRQTIGSSSLPLVLLALSRLNPQYKLQDLVVVPDDEQPPL